MLRNYPCINCGLPLTDCAYDHRCCDDSDHPYETFREMRGVLEADATKAERARIVALVEAEAEELFAQEKYAKDDGAWTTGDRLRARAQGVRSVIAIIGESAS